MAGSVLISGEMLRFGAKICCHAASLPGILTGITSMTCPGCRSPCWAISACLALPCLDKLSPLPPFHLPHPSLPGSQHWLQPIIIGWVIL